MHHLPVRSQSAQGLTDKHECNPRMCLDGFPARLTHSTGAPTICGIITASGIIGLHVLKHYQSLCSLQMCMLTLHWSPVSFKPSRDMQASYMTKGCAQACAPQCG